jgi:hypothetical protein
MTEPASWRELLNTIISNLGERERIANEIGVRPVTLTRWVSGASVPRPENLRQLVSALPQQYHAQFLALLEQDSLTVSPAAPVSQQEIAYTFIMEVFETRSNVSDMLRFWSISHLVLQQALRQLDPERVGIAITVVRCMPPRSDGKIHSLRESVGLGTPPWGGDLEPKALFLGAESLAGYVVTICRPEAIQDLRVEGTLLPAYQTEHEVSATAHPILLAGRVAGCLLLSSTQPNYFLSEARRSLIRGFANLVALAFAPEEFYAPECIELGVIPPIEVQQTYFTGLRDRVLTIMRESTSMQRPLVYSEAEQVAWQQIEALLLHLPRETANEI